ncbi:MAG: hypothetical protein V4662_09240 [Verrucomicrobiota bacterium]
MEPILKRLFLAVLVVVLPLGFHSAVGHETTMRRNYVTWFGVRLTPYKVTDDDLSLWIKNTVGHHPATEEWTQTTLGVWWFPGVIGTPPGNWFYLHNMPDLYLKAKSEADKQKVMGFARQIVEAKSPMEKSKMYESWQDELVKLTQ